MRRYLRSLTHHPGFFFALFLTTIGAVTGAQRGSANAVVVGAAMMSIFWIPVLVTAAQYDYGQDS
jgi:hypothetical protein